MLSWRQYMAIRHMSADTWKRPFIPDDQWWLDRMAHTDGYLEKRKGHYRLTKSGVRVLEETKEKIDEK